MNENTGSTTALGLKSIELPKDKYGTQLRETALKIFKWDWIFSSPIEKLIVLSSLIWGIYSIIKFVWGIF